MAYCREPRAMIHHTCAGGRDKGDASLGSSYGRHALVLVSGTRLKISFLLRRLLACSARGIERRIPGSHPT
jgi:hypothetical protein